ncbi:DUF5675 family protein [Pedobacter sp. SYSU D00535]|uniref:DUF5675 family protein n=1 Tax=Pedobacter sp. SYSU D00535 TaxID=2810308 RepID=UPI001A96EBE1|nr:DUF5675 family protein [Pedobacter sp. SYSU D00535]
MELKLVRSVFNPKSTFGKLFVNGEFFAYTCEDTVRDLKADCSGKIKNQTAIRDGRYEVVLSYSNRFKKYLPLLLNVKCFEGIRIHGGNTAEDSEGCILVGAEGDMKTKIWNCASKVNGLISLLRSIEKKEKMWIEIVREEKAPLA